ncbi:MAG: EamA family transporter [Aureliella sp.]
MNWLLWALLSAVFAALTAIFAKIGLKGINSDFATLVRTFVIVVALSLFVWATRAWSNPFRLPGRTLGFLIASGLATGLSWVCYFRALQLGQASQVAPVDKLSVVLVAVFAVAFLGERPSAGQWFGIVLIGVGTLVLALKK